jgi:phosphomannomutase
VGTPSAAHAGGLLARLGDEVVTVDIEPSGRVANGVPAAAEAEAQRLAAFLGGELDLAWTTP